MNVVADFVDPPGPLGDGYRVGWPRGKRAHRELSVSRLPRRTVLIGALSRAGTLARRVVRPLQPKGGMDVEIQTRDVDMQPEWRALIDQRLARLADRYPKLTRVHVTLKHGRHHVHGVEEVDIVAGCAGATIRAAKQEGEMRDAVHAALDVLESQLAAYHEQRRP